MSHPQTSLKCKQQQKASLPKKLSLILLGTASVIVGMAGAAEASVLYNPATGHYYEFVPGMFTWDEAKSAAEARVFNNLQGYLTTITSQAEMDFIVSNLILPSFPNPPDPPGAWTNFDAWGWIGASDAEQEGTWKWVTGPETGTVFWSGGSNGFGGSPVGDAYSNWSFGEPNNLGEEDYAHIDYRPIAGTWNDWTAWALQGYYVEYGSGNQETVPEPASTLGLLALGVTGVRSLWKRKQQQQAQENSLR